MTILILVISGIVFASSAVTILLIQEYRIRRHLIDIDSAYDGPAQVSTTIHAVIRYALKRSIYLRKFIAQYFIHIMVRIMYYIDMWTSLFYAKSRNWFVENAVRNRGTVPHFWEHLKVYKKEMDKEKEEEKL